MNTCHCFSLTDKHKHTRTYSTWRRQAAGARCATFNAIQSTWSHVTPFAATSYASVFCARQRVTPVCPLNVSTTRTTTFASVMGAAAVMCVATVGSHTAPHARASLAPSVRRQRVPCATKSCPPTRLASLAVTRANRRCAVSVGTSVSPAPSSSATVVSMTRRKCVGSVRLKQNKQRSSDEKKGIQRKECLG